MRSAKECRGFQESLEACAGAELTEPEWQKLKEHAATCRECEILLQMRESLPLSIPEELDSQVPEPLVRGIWPRLRAEIEADEFRRVQAWWRREPRWLMPALAACVALLILGSTGLYREWRRVQDREERLVQRFERQEQLMTALAARLLREHPVRRAGREALRPPSTAPIGMRVESIDELADLLANLPPDLRLLGASESEMLFARLANAQIRSWQTSIAGIDASDGLQVSEAVQLVQRLGPVLEDASAARLRLFLRGTPWVEWTGSVPGQESRGGKL